MDFHRIKQIVQTQHTLLENEWKGAVLFLCNEEYVFFIKRSEKMPTHGGQMAFVGGHRKDDESDPWVTAQREFEEETNLSRTSVDFLGYLPIVITARLQPIVPVLGRLLIPTDEFIKTVKSNGEWDDVVAYPWTELLKEDRWEFGYRIGYAKGAILFHSIPKKSFLSQTSTFETHLLWGATAGMVWDLLRLYYKDQQ